MNTEQDAAGEMTQDLEVVRGLLQKYGPEYFNSMVTLASFRGSTASTPAPSLISSSATFASRTTTSSSIYPESVSSGRDSMEVPLAQWQPTSAPTPISFPVTPIDSSFPSQTQALALEAYRDNETDASADGAALRYQCPLCAEAGIDKPIKRKTDLKRHFNNIHASDSHWVCKFQIGGGCGATFDFQAAYEEHVKREHNGFKDLDAKVNLCQQVVFACGFERCREVFEASTDADGRAVRAHYFEHILSHLSAGHGVHWSYCRRMRNLLRQSIVYATWKEYDRDTVDLTWEPESSSLLRKVLECRHLIDVRLLCSYAIHLGSAGTTFAPPVPPVELAMPLLNDCALVSHCHQPRQDIRFLQGALGSVRGPQHPPQPKSKRSRTALYTSPAMQSPAAFISHSPTPINGPFHEIPPPSATLPSQQMELNADAMDDADDIIMFPIHKSLEYFVGPIGAPMENQVGPFVDDACHPHAGRSRISSRRHVLAKKSMERLRAIRNAADGDSPTMGTSPMTPPLCTMPQNQPMHGPQFMSGYEI